MPTKGGIRKGAGRPTKADEERVRTLAVSAIVKVYGSESKGFEALIRSGDPSLIKWAFEHAYGKPKERVEMKHEGGIEIVFKKANAS